MLDNPHFPTIIPLRCPVTHHAWGITGAQSLVAHLHSLNNQTYIASAKPYSELIISSYSPHVAVLDTTGPGSDDSVPLSEHVHAQVIEVDPSFVKFYTQLHQDGVPYILRVVAAVSSPTGLAVHPAGTVTSPPIAAPPRADIDIGGEADDGGEGDTDADSIGNGAISPRFQRPFAKPLLLLAVRQVHLLLGLNPAAKIVAQLSRVPEFADAVGRPATDAFVHVVKSAVPTAAHVRSIVLSLFTQDAEIIEDCLKRAVDRLTVMPGNAVTEDDICLMAFAKHFPSDPMCFCAYLLNSVKLEAGEAIFIEPGEPYCIVSGTFVEASSKSDAIFCAGLADSDDVNIEAFMKTASFSDTYSELSQGENIGKYGKVYMPPVADFQLTEINLPKATSQTLLQTIAPSIVLVLGGEGNLSLNGSDVLLPLRAGSVYYLNPQKQYLIANRDDDEAGPLHVVQIGVNESAVPALSSSCLIM